MTSAKKSERPARYVEYVRVSTDDQVRSATHENQRNALARLATTRPGEAAAPGPFEDLGVSGAIHLEDRPGWRALEERIQQGDVREIRVYDITRLTRDDGLTDCERLVRLMREHDAHVLTTDGEVIRATSSMDLLLLVVRAMGAAEERKRIMKRTMEGKTRRLREGKPGAGCRPTGIDYSKEAGFSINPHWGPIIRRIFAMVIGGDPLLIICERLNGEGIAPPRGSQWNHSWVSKIIKNPAYKGDLRQHSEGKEYQLTGVPAIVDEETWDEAQAALASRHRVPLRAHYSVPALCRTLVHCGRCGHRMHVLAGNPGSDTSPRRKRTHTRYFCPACKGLPYHRADKVDDEVWRVVMEALQNSDDLLADAIEAPADEGGIAEQEIQEAVAALARIDRKTRGFNAQFAADNLTFDMLGDALSMLRTQREHAERRLTRANRAKVAAERAREQRATLAESIGMLQSKIQDADDATRREIVEAIVPLGAGQIRLHPDCRIEILGALHMVSEASTESGLRRR